MKLFFSEFKANYSQYHFPYQVWLLKEEEDEIDKIYGNGFLPMRNLPQIYYLSRNIRVNLEKFELSSENRRILKKTVGFESDLVPLFEFNYTPEVQKLCKVFSQERFGKGVFSTRGLQTIFKSHIYNYVFEFKHIRSQQLIGFAVCFISGNLLQYAHAFYDLKYLSENLGARMILQAVVWAHKSQKKFAYLGTCYEEKSLYKTEFKGVEFFNGFRWSENLDELKELIREGKEEKDEPEGQEYLLKRKEFLEEFYQGDLLMILNKYGVRVNI